MLSAEYFGSGSVARDTFGHYGLASPIYTHFTSPIRRYAGKRTNLSSCARELSSYADVLAHRQLSAAIGYTTLHATLHSKAHVERVLEVVNRRHRMAQMASRASVEFYVGLALKARRQKGQVREEAFVIRTFRNGLGVFVSKYHFHLISPTKRTDSLPVQVGYRGPCYVQARHTVRRRKLHNQRTVIVPRWAK